MNIAITFHITGRDSITRYAVVPAAVRPDRQNLVGVRQVASGIWPDAYVSENADGTFKVNENVYATVEG